MLYQLPNPLALKGYGETSKDVCNNEGATAGRVVELEPSWGRPGVAALGRDGSSPGAAFRRRKARAPGSFGTSFLRHGT
jgi:hypothetical protein